MAVKTNLADFSSPAFGGPYGIHGLALPGVAAPIYDGCWVPMFGAKLVSLELAGSMDTLGVDVYGSNSLGDPGNGYTITVGGSETDGDIVTLNISNPNLPAGVVNVSHTAAGGETVAQVAAALNTAINAQADLNALGIKSSVLSAVITLSYPSVAAQSGNSNPSQPGIANPTTVAYTKGSNSETVTIAVTTNGTKLGSTLAAFGLTALTVVPRWVKARLTTLTGAGATVTGRFAAST